MTTHRVIRCQPYPLSPGQKIHITHGPRHGDWEVLAVTDYKLTLRCPVSRREFTWERFCYVVEERDEPVWPTPDE